MAGERTEQATPHRREQARKEGDLLHSRELSAAAGTLAGVIALGMLGGSALGSWRTSLAAFLDLGDPARWEPAQLEPTLSAIRRLSIAVLAPAATVSGVVAALPNAAARWSFSALLGELAVGLVYGLTLALLNEMLLFAGQLAGLQFSFSLVNLLDPASSIQTPLLGEMFTLMGTLVVLAAGLDRILLASMVRSFRAAPLGAAILAPISALTIVRAAGGIFLAAVELAAPVLAATLLVEVAVSLLGKISPQLPVMSLTVPLKTLTGFALLAGSLGLWPRFIEARFAGLLDLAERLIAPAGGGR